MPPLPDVASVLKVEFLQDYSGGPVVNIIHFGYDGGPPSVANLNSFAGTCAAKWHSDIHPRQNPDLHLDSVVVTDLTSATSARGTAPGGTSGTNAGNLLAAGTAVVIQKVIARRYRGGHPRLYLAGANQADLATPQLLTSAAQGNWGNAADLLYADLVTAGCPGTTGLHSVSVSYHTGHALRPVPVVDDIIAIDCDLRIGSQRRRNGGR